MSHNEPVTLELASLPREQIGPFLLLGLEKDANAEQLEAHWAQRVIWARKGSIPTPLQDINWAREVLNDFERRVQADMISLNADTIEGSVREIAARYGMAEPPGPIWEPLDVEKPLLDYTPPADMPDAEALRRAITIPPVPDEVPAAMSLLEQLARQPVDPWGIHLPNS
jgi:hypothetical protein